MHSLRWSGLFVGLVWMTLSSSIVLARTGDNCSRIFVHGGLTSVEEVLTNHWQSHRSDFSRRREMSFRAGQKILMAAKPLYEVSRTALADRNAKVADYFNLNRQRIENLHNQLSIISKDAQTPEHLARLLRRRLSKFEVSRSVLAQLQDYVAVAGHEPLRTQKGVQEFEQLVSGLIGNPLGTLGELLVAALVLPEAPNQYLRDLPLPEAFFSMISQSDADREIDMIERTQLGHNTWSEVKFSLAGVRLESSRGRAVLKQAKTVSRILAQLDRVGIHQQHRIYLVMPSIDPTLVEALKATGAEVIHVDPFREFSGLRSRLNWLNLPDQ